MKKTLLFILKLGIAAGILFWLIRRSGLDFQSAAKVPLLYPALAVACLLIQLTLTIIRWHFLLRCVGIRLPFREIYSLGMQGQFFSLFIPAGSVGGDLIKAGILAKRSPGGEKFNGVFSILVDRLCGLTALMLFTLLGCAVFFPVIRDFPAELRFGIYTAMILCAGVLCATAAVFFHDILYRFPFMKKILSLLDRFSKGAFTRAADAIALYRKNWKHLLGWIAATTFVFFPFLAAALWFLGIGVCGRRLPVSLCLLASNLSQTAAAVPLTNGGIGVRDAVSAKIFLSGGCTAEQAALIPLIFTLSMLIVSLSGSIFFVFDSFLCSRKEKETCKMTDAGYNKQDNPSAGANPPDNRQE